MNSDVFLQKIISTLSTSRDFRSSIDNLARLATEGLADWCGVYLFEKDQTIRRLAMAPTSQVEALFPFDLHATVGPAHVRRTGECEQLTNPGADVARGLGIKPEELVVDGSSPSVYACLPVVARNRTIGAVAFMSASPKQRFTEIELSLAASLASAASVAMDHSRLYREAQEAN